MPLCVIRNLQLLVCIRIHQTQVSEPELQGPTAYTLSDTMHAE